MTQTNVDLSRFMVEDLARALIYCDHEDILQQASTTLRALLDAKEAAERDRDEAAKWRDEYQTALRIEKGSFFERAGNLWQPLYDHSQAQLTEARAANASAWEAGRDAAADHAQNMPDELVGTMELSPSQFTIADSIRKITTPNPDATEALRAVKETVWAEGARDGATAVHHDKIAPNPYAKKDTA